MSRRTDGYVAVRYFDGASLTFASCERERLVTAFREGARVFEGRDEYGGDVVCSMENVRAVCYYSPAVLAASREEEKLDAIEGVS